MHNCSIIENVQFGGEELEVRGIELCLPVGTLVTQKRGLEEYIRRRLGKLARATFYMLILRNIWKSNQLKLNIS